MNAMFSQLRREQNLAQPSKSTGDGNVHKLGKFVDLGSGDGRVVFRAAREDMFRLCVGYEINPMLHGWALWQRLVAGPAIWRSTRFYRADLWHVDLRDADVVAVVRSSLADTRLVNCTLATWPQLTSLFEFSFCGIVSTVWARL
jgi:hypothetical protein